MGENMNPSGPDSRDDDNDEARAVPAEALVLLKDLPLEGMAHNIGLRSLQPWPVSSPIVQSCAEWPCAETTRPGSAGTG